MHSPPPPLLILGDNFSSRSTNILGISSMILVLSTMHISQMILKRKKSYQPKGDEREGVGGGEQDRGSYPHVPI